MKERPILFSAPMVRAILDGRKTQTRRKLKHPVLTKPPYFFSGETRTDLGYPASADFFWAGFRSNPDWHNVSHPDLIGSASYVKCPYGQPGDRLWVKETWKPDPSWGYPESTKPTEIAVGTNILYRATLPEDHPKFTWQRWRPSLFMRRWMSRITLEVVSVRVERLQDISEEDARAEGVPNKSAYRELWESINGAGSWAENPWVWVIEFRPLDFLEK